MKFIELCSYTKDELFTFETVLFENSNSEWEVQQSKAFKKGYKKHSQDKKVIENVKDIVKSLSGGVHPKDLSPTYNPHPIKKSKSNPWYGYWDVHVKGPKIIMLFEWDPQQKVIRLAHLGTHQEAKLTKD